MVSHDGTHVLRHAPAGRLVPLASGAMTHTSLARRAQTSEWSDGGRTVGSRTRYGQSCAARRRRGLVSIALDAVSVVSG